MRRFALPLLFSLLLPASVAAQPAGHAGTNLTKIAQLRTLRCDAQSQGKIERMKADVYRNQSQTAVGPTKQTAKQKLQDSELKAQAAFETAGNMKARQSDLTERYVSARRLDWYATVDEAERIHLEEKILLAQEMLDSSCEE